jgi:AraC family transcriptional regulator
MKEETLRAYAERIRRVIDYVSAHLHEELSVEQLSRVAAFSKFHFHRQFSEYTGISVARLVRLMRLKRASYQLVFNKPYRIIDIAMDAGFANAESFSRAFKAVYGQSPSSFRSAPQWASWSQVNQYPQPRSTESVIVEIVDFPLTRVAVLEHRGSRALINASVGKFIEWRKASGLSPVDKSRTFGVPYPSPEQLETGEFRFDICGEVHGDVPVNPQGVIGKVIPAGRCAVVEHKGSTDALDDTVRWLYAEWLPSSGEELREFPVYFHYVKRMPTVAEHEQVTRVHLPLR